MTETQGFLSETPKPTSADLLSDLLGSMHRSSVVLFHPLLRDLPRLIHLSPGGDPGDDWLAATTRRTAQKATRAEPGGRCMFPV